MSNTNTEVLTTAYEKLQGAITQSDTVLSNLQEAIESGNLQNYATTSQLEDIANKNDNINNRMKVNGFLTILNSVSTNTNKSDEQIQKNINDLADAHFDGFAMVVEVMPSAEQKTDFINGTITQTDLTWNCYPSANEINRWLTICEGKGLKFNEIKFHSLWVKQNISSLDLASFMSSYSDVVLNTLDSLYIKPIHATIINEFGDAITTYTIPVIQSLLTSIKGKGYITGLTGTNPTTDLIDYVDNYYLHFYPAVSFKKMATTFQDAIDGWDKTRIYEKYLKPKLTNYPTKGIIIDEVGCSNYWEALASPELYMGNKGFTSPSNGMPMALYANGAIEYFKSFNAKEISIFWTDTVPSELQNVIKRYKGVI